MNISNLFKFSASNSWSNANSPAKSVDSVSPLALAVQRADKRIQTEVDTNTAQLSSFGQLKSLVSNVQIAANALSNLPASPDSTDAHNALNSMVSAFNDATNTAQSTAALPGAPEASQSAARVGKDLQNAISADTTSAEALKQIGISLQNGSLVVDDKTFSAALTSDLAGVQTTLTTLGRLIDKTASAELEANGNVTDSMKTLSQHARVLDAQQSALQSATQATAPAQGRATGALGYGLAAYQSHMNKG